MINSGLPDNPIFQTNNHRTSRMGIHDDSGKNEIKQMEDFWENFSNSDEEEVAKSENKWEKELLQLENLMFEESKKMGEDEAANHGDVCFPDLIQL